MGVTLYVMILGGRRHGRPSDLLRRSPPLPHAATVLGSKIHHHDGCQPFCVPRVCVRERERERENVNKTHGDCVSLSCENVRIPNLECI